MATYKYGQNDIDLDDYIYNLGDNVGSFLESQSGWSDSQKQQFKNAYDVYAKGLSKLLSDSSNRFSTSDTGDLIDTSGEFGGANIPTGYVNSKGESISEEEYNNLSNKKKKDFSRAFNAYGEVVSFANKVARAQADAKKNKKRDKFDFGSNGFLNYWNKVENPAGGKQDINLYWDLDETDPNTNKKGRNKRAELLAKRLTEYRDSIEDDKYDFADTTFKDTQGYKKAIDNVIGLLNDGTFNNDDLRALQSLGVGQDFYKLYFAEDDDWDKSKEEIEAKLKEEEEKRKKEESEKKHKDFVDSEYKKYSDYVESMKRRGWNDPNAFLKYTEGLSDEFNDDDGNWSDEKWLSSKDAKLHHDNAPKYYKELFEGTIKNEDGTPGNTSAYKRRLTKFLHDADLNGVKDVTDRDGNTLKFLPWGDGGYNKHTNTVFVYNPATQKLERRFIGDIPEMWDEILKLNGDTDIDNPASKYYKQGGKFLFGGNVDYQAVANLQYDSFINNRAKEEGRTKEESVANNRIVGSDRSNLAHDAKGWTTTDIVRLGSAAADLGSLVSAFAGPGVGTAASVGLGIASDVGNLYADIKEDGFQWSDVGNFAKGLGLDVLGAIPVVGTTSKVAKITKSLTKYGSRMIAALSTMQGLANADLLINPWKKLSNGEKLTVDDYRKLISGVLLTLGLGTGAVRGLKNKKQYNNFKQQAQNRVVIDLKDKTGAVKKYSFMGADADAIRAAKGDASKINAVVNKYEGMKEHSVVVNNTKKGLQWVRKDGKWQSPIGSTDLARVRDAYSTDNGNTLMVNEGWRRGDTSVNKTNPGATIEAVDAEFAKQKQNVIDDLKTRSDRYEKGLEFQRNRLANADEAGVKSQLNGRSSAAMLQELNDANNFITSKGGKVTVENIIKQRNNLQGVISQRLTKQTDLVNKLNALQSEISDLNNQLSSIKGKGSKVKKAAITSLIATKQAELNKVTKKVNTANKNVTKAQQDLNNFDAATPDILDYQKNLDIHNKGLTPEYHEVRTLEDKLKLIDRYKQRLAAAESGHTHAYNRYLNKVDSEGNLVFDNLLGGGYKRTAENWKEILNNAGIKYLQGGNLKKKFLSGGETPEYYSKLFDGNNALDGWNSTLNSANAGESIVNTDNKKHGHADSLNEAFAGNQAYIQSGKVGEDLQNYYNQGKYSSIDDFVNKYNLNINSIYNYWKQKRKYNELTGNEINPLFKLMYGSRSGSGKDAWDIGYQLNLELKVGSSTWLRRPDIYSEEFNGLKDRIHKIDLGEGKSGYVYKKQNGEIGTLTAEQIAQYVNPIQEEIVDPNKRTITSPAANPFNGNNNEPDKRNSLKLDNLLNKLNDNALGFLRFGLGDHYNKRMTNLALKNEKALLLDPFKKNYFVTSDLDAETNGNRAAGRLYHLAQTPVSSDPNSQHSLLLEGASQGLDKIIAGNEKSNQTLRENSLRALQTDWENNKNAHDVAMQNRNSLLQAASNKSKYKQALLSKQFTNLDTLLKQFEYERKTNALENKQRANAIAQQDIQDSVYNRLKDYAGNNLSDDELSVWNRTLSGEDTYSSLNAEDQKKYLKAKQIADWAMRRQQAKYYGISDNDWSEFSNSNSPISKSSGWTAHATRFRKNGGSLRMFDKGGLVEIAKLKAKISNADRLSKNILKTLERHEKILDRISKSLYGYPKVKIIE